MLTKNQQDNRNQQQIISIEDVVPKTHLVRKLDKAIDFTFIYGLVSHLYSQVEGRPSIDPVVLFKLILLKYIFGIRSIRQTIKEIEVNMAYRWFLGYGMTEAIPHFTTFGKNYERRFKDTDVFEKIFEQILQEAVTSGFVDASAVFIDATHIKASANKQKATNEVIAKKAKHYHNELMDEINKDRASHGKKPFIDKAKDDEHDKGGKNDKNSQNDKSGNDTPPPSQATKNIKVSKTDPESGLFHKGEHEKMFAYTAHTACDKHGFILGSDVSAGNTHDSVMFDGLYKQVIHNFPEIEAVAVDSGYKTPWIMKQIFDSGRIAAVPYKRPMTKEGFYKKHEYVYDKHYDCYLCPENQVLKYTTTSRDGYREYKSNPRICEKCPSRHQCTASKNCTKVVIRHVWEGYMERAEDMRHTPEGKAIYAQRKETIELVFADAKEKHSMRYTHYRGLANLKMETLLTFAAMNLKKMAIWKNRNDHSSMLFRVLLAISAFSEKIPPIRFKIEGLSSG